MLVDFTNIVDQSEQLPLHIHLGFRPQGEMIQVLLHTDISEYRLDNAQTSGVDSLALFGIDLCLHRIEQIGWLRTHWHGKISARCGWLAQTTCSHWTGGAVLRAGMVNIIGSIAVGLVAGMTGQFLSLRTEVNLPDWIEREVRSGEETRLGVWSLPAVDAILEALLIGKARIAFAKLDVGDISIDLFIPACNQTVI